MWFLFLVLLLNAVLAQYDVVNVYRINFGGGILVGVFEVLMIIGLLLSVIIGGRYAARLPEYRKNRLYGPTLFLLWLGIIFGFLGDLIYGADIKTTLSLFRDYAAFPIAIFMGYRLTPSLRSVKVFLYVVLLCGLATAVVLIAHFGQNAEEAGIRNSFNSLRTVQYVTSYAGLACLMMVFSVVNPQSKLMPVLISICLAAFLLIGFWAPMNRGDWVCTMVLFASLPFYLPQGRRLIAVLRIGIAMPMLFIALIGAVSVANAVTQRDMGKRITTRLMSLLPGDNGDSGSDGKAWDTRWPAAQLELSLWMANPLMGTGFSAENRYMQRNSIQIWGFNHNGWASVLAKVGVFGFAATVLVYFSLWKYGRQIMRESTDPIIKLMGFTCAIGGEILAVLVVVTMSWHARNALLFGTVLGVAYKCADLVRLKQEHGSGNLPTAADEEYYEQSYQSQGAFEHAA